MPPARSHIRELVTAYLDRYPEEITALVPLSSALDAAEEPTARSTLPGHITCSAVVIDHVGRVLLVRHNASGGLLLAPGGHVESDDATLMATAQQAPQHGLRRSRRTAGRRWLTGRMSSCGRWA